VLIAALVGGAVALLIMPNASTIPVLAAAAVLLGMSTAAVSAMIFGLLATEVPPERRSATLNLVYLPLYLAGTIGPAMAGVVVTILGVSAPFVLGALVFVFGAATILVLGRRDRGQAVSTGA
jgi:DHA2 family lincomycin resistance protein-like MFS transporter